jgi:hypothetical protein
MHRIAHTVDDLMQLWRRVRIVHHPAGERVRDPALNELLIAEQQRFELNAIHNVNADAGGWDKAHQLNEEWCAEPPADDATDTGEKVFENQITRC